MGQGTIGEFRDGSKDTRLGPGRVGRPSERSEMVWRTLGEGWDGSQDTWGVRDETGDF